MTTLLDFLSLADFHWLRPLWLLAIIPAVALFVLLLRRKANSNQWKSVIDPALLNALLENQSEKKRQWPWYALLCAWIFSTISLAGPSFEKTEQPVLKNADALVVILDLSPSMLATDVKPSRIQAAHFKLLDLLRERQEGYTALIVYSGSAHIVTPLSDDTNTIATLVNTLEPTIMPKIGSRAEDAVSAAIQLLHNANFQRGRLLLVTDGVVPAALDSIHKQLRNTSIELNVIGIGTAEGAPIPLRNGGFVEDAQGKIVMNPLEEDILKKLASNNGGYYSSLRADDADIAPLSKPSNALTNSNNKRNDQRNIEHWLDSGYWLVFPCLLVALLFFRRGAVVCVLPLALFLYQENAHAELPKHWNDWWQTPDQQAAKALEKGDTKTAAQQFQNPQWKAYAEYQNGQHKEAAAHFATGSDTASLYNKGNAQAKSNDLQGAISSYEKALKQNPKLEDAVFNRDLVKKLLEQQKQQNNDQQNQDNQQNQQNNNENTANDSKENTEQEKQQAQQDQQRQENTEKQKEQQSKEQNSAQEQQPENNKASESEQEQKTEPKSAEATANSQMNNEQQQAVKQMLNVVPDDPGGLLRNKFDYYYQLQQQQGTNSADNGGDRW